MNGSRWFQTTNRKRGLAFLFAYQGAVGEIAVEKCTCVRLFYVILSHILKIISQHTETLMKNHNSIFLLYESLSTPL